MRSSFPAPPLPPCRDNVLAVLISRDPDAGLAERAGRVLPQVAGLVVVDNGSRPAGRASLAEVARLPGVRVVENGRNLGVAAALNQGARRALDEGFQWLLCLDQDTELDADYVARLVETLEKAGAADARPVALAGANYSQQVGEVTKVGRVVAPGETAAWLEEKTVITSGSLLALAAFVQAGPFLEKLFIDHVDHEYCLRLRHLGWRVVLDPTPRMRHAVGRVSYHYIWGRRLETSNHSAIRRYYWYRNGTWLVRRELGREPGWAWRMLGYCFTTQVVNIWLFEDDKAAKTRMALLGVLHGLLGRFDRAPAGLEGAGA